MRRVALPLLLAVLVVPNAAHAARPATGNWTGTVARSTATITFHVDRNRARISRLVVRLFPVFCSSTEDTSFDTWDIPSISVRRDGRFKRTYRPERHLVLIARGRFTAAGRVTGYVEEQAAGGVCVGGLPFRAHRRG